MESKSLEQRLSDLHNNVKDIKLICGLGLIICVLTISVAEYLYFRNRDEIDKTDNLQYNFIKLHDEEIEEIFNSLDTLKTNLSIHSELRPLKK